MFAHRYRVALLAGALATLGGCAVYPAGGPYYGGPADQVVVAPYGPPPLVAESYGVAPYPGDLWIGGYWGWSGGRHVWTPGRWEHPRAGYHWVPRTWEQHGNQWHQRGGHWQHG
jgi:hypothetical protein